MRVVSISVNDDNIEQLIETMLRRISGAVKVAKDMLDNVADNPTIFKSITTGDETWVYAGFLPSKLSNNLQNGAPNISRNSNSLKVLKASQPMFIRNVRKIGLLVLHHESIRKATIEISVKIMNKMK